jgi:hypothetical protein
MASLASLQLKLDNYEQQQELIRKKLVDDPGNMDLLPLLQDLEDAIEMTREIIEQQRVELSNSLVFEVGDRVMAYYQADKMFWPATVLAKLAAGSYLINFIGFSADVELPITLLKPFVPVSVDDLSIGQEVLAIYSRDAKFYRAVIDHISAEGVVKVTFVKYGNSELVAAKNIITKVRKEQEVIPAAIASVSGGLDTEKDKEKDKKKGKSGKHRRAGDSGLRREEQEQKQANWLKFKDGAAMKKKGAPKKESMFRVPEGKGRVGVVGSGQGVTTYRVPVVKDLKKMPQNVANGGD